MKAIGIVCSLLLIAGTALAYPPQTKRVVIRVLDGRKQSVKGVQLRIRPNGVTSKGTDQNGYTWIDVPKDTLPSRTIPIEIVNSRGQDWVVIGSDDNITVPSFDIDAGTDNVATLMVMRRGDPELLVNGYVLYTSAIRIIQKLTPVELLGLMSPQQRRAALVTEAKRIGVGPNNLDKAILAFKEKANDPFQKGIVASYAQRYEDASSFLEESYKQVHSKVYEVAVNLGLVKYRLGYYSDAARLFQEALTERPDDYKAKNDLGLMRLLLAQYEEAEHLFNSSLEIMKLVLKPDDINIVTTLQNKGWLLRDRNDFDGARKAYDEASNIIKSRSRPQDPEIASMYNDYGTLDQDEGNYSNAEESYNKAILIYAKLPKYQFECANVIINLASAKRENGDLNSAVVEFEKALTILNRLVKKRTITIDHLIFARLHNQYAGVFDLRQQYTDAERHFDKAKEIRQKNFGETHPEFAAILHNLGKIYATTNRMALAQSFLEQASAIQQRALGKDHPDFGRTETSLGGYFLLQGNLNEAEVRLNIALAILENKRGYELRLASVYDNLGGLSLQQKKAGEAETFFRKSVQLRSKFIKQQPLGYTRSLVNLADLYVSTQRYTDAEPLFQDALRIREAIPGVALTAIVEVLLPYGLLFARQEGKREQALPLWQRALNLTDHPPSGTKSILLARSLNNLGALYRILGRLQDSEPLLKRAYEMWPAIEKGETEDMITTCNHYASLLKQLGRETEANEVIKRAEQIRQKINRQR